MEALEQTTQARETSPKDTMAYWKRELSDAKDRLKDWKKRGDKIVQRFLDERADRDEMIDDGEFRLNLFHANVKTLESLLYENLPKAQIARRFLDANDDPARIAGTMIERIVNADIQENGRERDAVLKSCLQDRLLPGLGCARVRYTFEAGETGPVNEQAPIDYYYWGDVLWGWGRSWAELPWIAYKSYLSKAEVEERFPGYENKVQYARQTAGQEDNDTDKASDSPHSEAEIWEIWDRSTKCVYWLHENCDSLLDKKQDPLQLSGFFPSPPFLIANATTRLYKPCPDYVIYQDLYNEIDTLQTRINIITEAVRVVGVYDSTAEGVQRMLNEGCENQLIPVESWALFAEKGGIKGAVDWLPITEVVGALDKLRQLRDDTIAMLQRVTGMADIMSGQVSPYEGVGQSEMKVAWGSVRVQALQNQFAQFVSDLLQLQAEVICKHFDPETIVERANVRYMMEPPENIEQAVLLLKSPRLSRLRIEVKAESVAQVDQGRVQAERGEFLNALSTYMQSMAPMLQQQPEAMPYLLQMLQWVLSGFRGANEIEGVLDKAVAESKKPKEDKPDPEQQKQQAQIQGEMQKIQAKAQADMQTRQADLQADLAEIQANSQARIQEIMAQHEAKMREIQASAEAKLVQERVGMDANIAQTAQAAAIETDKDIVRMDEEERRGLNGESDA